MTTTATMTLKEFCNAAQRDGKRIIACWGGIAEKTWFHLDYNPDAWGEVELQAGTVSGDFEPVHGGDVAGKELPLSFSVVDPDDWEDFDSGPPCPKID